MHFCIFAHTEDNQPKPQEKPWKWLAMSLTKHRETSVDKNAPGRVEIPLLSFVTYKPGTLRAKYNVQTVNAAALDIDYITSEEWNSIQRILEQNEISSFWYTTFSHQLHDRPDNFKLRLCLELSRPVTGQEWAQIFPFFKEHFQADSNASDASRMFFGPFIPSGTQHLHFSGIQEGSPFDVDNLLKVQKRPPTVVDLPPEPSITVTKEMLTKLSADLKRRSDTYSQLASSMIRHLRDGEKFTEEGHRDEAVFRYIISSIVKKWPNLNTTELTALATPSLELNGGVTPDQFTYKVERAKQERQKYLEDNYLKQKQKHENSIAKTNTNRQLVGMDAYYINDTLPVITATTFANKELDIPIGQAKIVQHQSDFYFWCNGTYHGPVQKTAFIQAAIKYLSPFEEIEVELFDNFGNLKEINLENFLSQHSTFVKEVVFALGSNQTALTKDALVLPYYPPLTQPLEYSWRVDHWIKFLFSGKSEPSERGWERVKWAWKWLCHYQDHNVLLPAILLVGATGAGKGLFAEWLSQAYEIPANVVSLNLLYNSGTENDVYPVMVADEEFPDCSSAQLREGITARNHILKKKYQNIRRVTGYIRHILILNDADRIKTFDVGVEAQRATAERFMYVNVTEKCREYLEALVKGNELLQPGELQKHIAWLREQNLYNRLDPGRFGVAVPEDNQAFYETFYRQKNRFAVLNVICDFICRDSYPIGMIERYGKWPIEVTETGEVKIRSAPFAAYCEDKLENRSKASLGQVVKSISEPVRTAKERYWRLQKTHIYRWAEIAMEYSDEEIKDGLNTTTESKVDSAVVIEKEKWIN